METNSATSPTNLARKYRKKLRQIENLERLNRPLTDEECVKVDSKISVREKLKDALDQLQEEIFALNRRDSSTDKPKRDECELSSPDSGSGEENELSAESPPETAVGLTRPTSSGAEAGDHPGMPDAALPRGSATKNVQLEPAESGKKTLPTSDNIAKPGKEGRSKKKGNQLFRRQCKVTCMDGHSDIIISLVVVDGRVVTASRDTSLKSWDLTTGDELRTFGGHTESVTCVLALEPSYGKLIDPDFQLDDHLIVSASFDCTFKLWSLNTGKLIKSVYTFNPLTKVCLCPATRQLISGSDGGKLEMWDMASGENCLSTLAFEASVTSIVVSERIVYCSSNEGTIKVYQLRDDGSLACLFVNDDIKTVAGRPLTPRHVRCMALIPQGHLMYGDDAKNLKLLDWKKDGSISSCPGRVSKLPNHTTNFTSTDAVCCHGNYILTSSYNLDDGLGYVNVREGDNLTYVATMDDQETERIICLDFCLGPSGDLVVVTGGLDLKLWHVLPPSASQTSPSEEDAVIQLEFRQALSQQAADSESESDSDDDDDDDDEEEDSDGWPAEDRDGNAEHLSQSSGWMSWCSIL